MHKIICIVLSALFISSCEIQEQTEKYYLRYVATSLEPRDTYTTVRLRLPEDRSLTSFYCTDKFDEEFGYYSSGFPTCFAVDEPREDTFIVRLYVRKRGEKEYHLLREEFNSILYTLP